MKKKTFLLSLVLCLVISFSGIVASNLTSDNNPQEYPFPQQEIKTIYGIKVALIGLATPETYYKAHLITKQDAADVKKDSEITKLVQEIKKNRIK